MQGSARVVRSPALPRCGWPAQPLSLVGRARLSLFIASTLIQHANRSALGPGPPRSEHFPSRQIHSPPHAMSPPGVGRHLAGPLESCGSVTCYLTNTQ